MKKCKICDQFDEESNFNKIGYHKPCSRQKAREWYHQNKNKILTQKKVYRRNNRLKMQEYTKEWNRKNPDKVRLRRKRYSEKQKLNILFRLAGVCRRRTTKLLNTKKWTKRNSFKLYIGCSLEELRSHLESKFLHGMTWDNYGEWHIDHIIPLSSAKTEDELYKLCHYSNLQPLWAEDNIKKGAKMPPQE